MKRILLTACVQVLLFSVVFAQKTWIGAGAGGAGTDFNTGSNWSPAGVPVSTDNVVIAITSDATITLSANASINNLTFTVNGNNDNARLFVGANTLTVNGNAIIDALAGNGSTDIEIGVNGGTDAGVIVFGGNVSLGPTNSPTGGAGFRGNANSRMVFRGNLTLGVGAYTIGGVIPGTIEFNGTGTQLLTYDNTSWVASFNNVVIGNSNNPTVQIAGTAAVDPITGNLTVNGSSVLDLSTRFLNRNVAGGSFSLNGSSTLRLGANTGGQAGSNFPLNFSTLTISATSTVEYYATSAQTIFDIASPGYGNLTITANSTKTPGNGLDIRRNLLINSTSTFAASTFTHNLGGNFTNNGTFTASTSTLVLNGTATQTIGGTTSTTFNNITFNNTSGGITLSQACSVNGVATFTSGIVTTTLANLLTMNAGSSATTGSVNSHVNGPMAKVGNTAFTFPVGNGTFYRTIGIGIPSASSTFRAQFFRTNPIAAIAPSTLGPGLTRISRCEYWNLERTAGTGNATVTLSWGTNSGCGAGAYVNDRASLRVARHTGGGGFWQDHGQASNTGSNTAGTVTSNSISSFSSFSLAASGTLNPLPVELSPLTAVKSGGSVLLEFSNYNEKDIAYYEWMRSENGRDFKAFQTQSPKDNRGASVAYNIADLNANEQTVYYKVKVVLNSSEELYSSIVKVSNSNAKDWAVLGNPVTKGELALQLSKFEKGKYDLLLLNSNGKRVMQQQLVINSSFLSTTLQLPRGVNSGVYYLILTGNGERMSKTIVVQ